MNQFSDAWGTTVNVQAMVYGNMGSNSGTGVAFAETPQLEKIFLMANIC
jgi:pyruvate,orthophosphate dikinase